MENAGDGPALEITGRLWSADGRHADLLGASMIGRGRTAVLSGTLTADTQPAPDRLSECRAVRGAPRFLVELAYTDVFGNAFTASAIFDPTGTGAWRELVVSGPASSPGTVSEGA